LREGFGVMGLSFSAVSVYRVVFKCLNRDFSFTCRVMASWAPLTVRSLIENVPFQTSTVIRDPLVFFPVRFRFPREKRFLTNVEAGDLVVAPFIPGLGLTLKDAKLRYNVVRIGKLEEPHVGKPLKFEPNDIFEISAVEVK